MEKKEKKLELVSFQLRFRDACFKNDFSYIYIGAFDNIRFSFTELIEITEECYLMSYHILLY